MGLAIKYNYKGLQDQLVYLFRTKDIEGFIRNTFPDRWILQMVLMLILFLLCI